MIEVVAVPPWDARATAGRYAGLVEKACSRASNNTPEELVDNAENFQAALWLVREGGDVAAVCFTRCVLSMGRRAVEVTAIGGSGAMRWAAALRNRLHDYRKAERAEFLSVVGRKGWGRMFNQSPVGVNSDGLSLFEDFG